VDACVARRRAPVLDRRVRTKTSPELSAPVPVARMDGALEVDLP